MRADGNAYDVVMTYRPSPAPVPAFTQPGNIFVSYPTTADRIEYSPDGKAWQALSAQQVGSNLQLGAVFTRPGYYMAAGQGGRPLTKRSSGGGGIVTGLLIMAAVAFVIFTPLIVLFVRRRPGKTPPKKGKPKKR